MSNAAAAHDVPDSDRRSTTRVANPPAAARRPAPAAGPAALLHLQRAAGNRAVSGLMAARAQPATDTGGPAPESVPATVEPLPGGSGTRPLPSVPSLGAAPPPPPAGGSDPLPPSVAATVSGLGANLLRAAMSPKAPAPSTAGAPLSSLGGGEPLPAEIRSPFERSYGYDLSPLRVHRGPVAQRAAEAANAAAFTLGDHIVVGGDLDLSGQAGRHILGHEVAHAVQGRLGPGSGFSGRVSDPSWASEREAERAAAAAASGQPYRITQASGPDLHRIAPWLILAGIGLIAGAIIWAASDSPEENQRRHQTGAENPADEIWALIPIYGSMQQIKEAESYFQRVLGVGFLMLDCVTLGSAGIAGRALLKAPGALLRTVATRQGEKLVIREGGEIATEAMLKETGATVSREGGTVLASQAAASTEMLDALKRGSMVVATEGGLNHAVIYARNAAGQVIKVHGGPLRVIFEEGGREISKKTTQSMAKKVNAYLIVEAAEAAVPIEEAVSQVSKGGPAALRWIGGNPTSCGIMQGALLEASGLSAETAGKLLPAGGAAGRMLPITILDQMLSSGRGLRIVEGGMSRIIGGTLIQGGVLGVGGAVGPTASTALRFIVNEATKDEPGPDDSSGAVAPSKDSANYPDARTAESDGAAIAIVNKYGRVLVGPVSTVRAGLPDTVTGWLVSSPAFHQAVGKSLIHLGMAPETANAIVA
ncbi:MAG: hypothetical protein QOH60_3135 [Mycobacterium sp.]|nr:hypothetical protein [Mycobacterium sp.]